MIVVFVPMLAFLAIGVIGMVRGKLERIGGGIALALGLIATGVNFVLLAAWSTDEAKAAGLTADVAQYIIVAASLVGFVGGLLAVIKPDRGGRFS